MDGNGQRRFRTSSFFEPLAYLQNYIDDPFKDSDNNVTRTPRKPFGAAAGGVYGGTFGGGGMIAGDLAAAAGTPSNLGRIGDAGEYLFSPVLLSRFHMSSFFSPGRCRSARCQPKRYLRRSWRFG